jgi:flagellar biosynthesis/type III secretory pathway ATPase
MGSFGPSDLTLALLATSLERYAEAERHFAAAVGHCERLHAQGWAAHARHGWARMLLAQGSAAGHDRSRDLAARALADADELGLTGLAGQLRALLDGR